MRIKKNDMVIILTGKERGMTGRVMSVDPHKSQVVVENRNMIQRHIRTGPQGQEGGIIPREAPMDASNVAVYSEKAGRGVRVRSRYKGAEGALFHTKREAVTSFGDDPPRRIQKVRFAPKTGEIFE